MLMELARFRRFFFFFSYFNLLRERVPIPEVYSYLCAKTAFPGARIYCCIRRLHVRTSQLTFPPDTNYSSNGSFDRISYSEGFFFPPSFDILASWR